MTSKRDTFQGLSSSEAYSLQLLHGKNELNAQKKQNLIVKLLHVVKEPMFLLLIIAATVYFILGQPRDGLVMLVFVTAIITIDVIQEWKTDKTLHALRDLSAPRIEVLRDGQRTEIASANLVPGDIMMIHEGIKIPADGRIISCNDLCVNESTLSGEAEGAWKVAAIPTDNGQPMPTAAATASAVAPAAAAMAAPDPNAAPVAASATAAPPTPTPAATTDYWRADYCYAGSLVIQGSGTVLVEGIGANTEYGRIGTTVAQASTERTPLQKQTARLVKAFAYIAIALCILVALVTWVNLNGLDSQNRFIHSILSGITLAMAMIPEEFPVVLTVFLSMGAWRLAKKRSLVHRLPSVETLGGISVLCVDKTGTITMNQMAVQQTWATDGNERHLAEICGLACETEAYDPMEQAMLSWCSKQGFTPERLFDGELIHEYAFTNELKMMAHVWRRGGQLVVAAKGSPEGILAICGLTEAEHDRVIQRIAAAAAEGLRLIAVATTTLADGSQLPERLTDCSLCLCGLVGLADPPRPGIRDDIAVCKQAGIRVVMITGDHAATAMAIAKQVGILEKRRSEQESEQDFAVAALNPHDKLFAPTGIALDCDSVINGDMLDKMLDLELRQRVKNTCVFSRVTPEHKLRIVKAFKNNGEVVAMTGDGVNDAPALKHADIGIAMGGRGSEVSREAADLILMDDNFSTIVDTVKDGRRIYDNIKKAMGYILTIHVPIALASLLAPLLGIGPGLLMLLPLHIVLLELMIDPTCSIVLERLPAEADIMRRRPRHPKDQLLNARMLLRSLAQGLAVFAAAFAVYLFVMFQGETVAITPAAATVAANSTAAIGVGGAATAATSTAALARSMGLAVVILANLFLVVVYCSERDSALTALGRLVHDKVMWLVCSLTLTCLAVILYSPLNAFLQLAPLSWQQCLVVASLAAASVLWFEAVKLTRRRSALKGDRDIPG
ncbi:MAG: cation-translocating P-type ATPase [Actinomycetia bacterium]|nr:cation-translocating P-type ATPase [Actinomycetes bacterium]